MSGTINQSSIEAVFENLSNDKIEKMSDVEREEAREFLLKEAVRYGAQEFDDSVEYLPCLSNYRIAMMSDEDRASMGDRYLEEAANYAYAGEGGAPPWRRSAPVPVIAPVPAPRRRPRPTPAPRSVIAPPRHAHEPCERDMIVAIDDAREESARLERANSLKTEYLTIVREQNKLMEEGARLNCEIEEAEDENTRIGLRKEDI